MPYFEVPSKLEHGRYKAVIGTDGAYETGKVIVQPPFTPGENLYGLFEDEVRFSGHLITEKSTVLDFRLPDAEDDPAVNRGKVEEEIDFLLGELGYADDIERFKAYWAQFKGTEQ